MLALIGSIIGRANSNNHSGYSSIGFISYKFHYSLINTGSFLSLNILIRSSDYGTASVLAFFAALKGVNSRNILNYKK